MFSPLTSILDIATRRNTVPSELASWSDRDLMNRGITRRDVTQSVRSKA